MKRALPSDPNCSAPLSRLVKRSLSAPNKILQLHEELSLRLDEVVPAGIVEIPPVIRRSRIEDRERIEFVAEKGIDIHRPAEMVVFRDKAEKQLAAEYGRMSRAVNDSISLIPTSLPPAHVEQGLSRSNGVHE